MRGACQVFGAASSPSKAALHAITLAFANEFETTTVKVNAACPGFTATGLNGFRDTRTVERRAHEAVRLALIGPGRSEGHVVGRGWSGAVVLGRREAGHRLHRGPRNLHANRTGPEPPPR